MKRQNLLRASTTDSRERVVLEEKLQGLEENQRIAENKLLETRSEKARMKAEMRHGPTRSDSRDGRGLLTSRSDENHSRLKEDIKNQESEVHRLRRERDEVHDWYTEAFNSYGEELKEAQEYENVNAELKHRLSETASASSSSPIFTAKVSRKEESKVKVPSWPKVNDLGLWKANLIQAIVIAANDSYQQP